VVVLSVARRSRPEVVERRSRLLSCGESERRVLRAAKSCGRVVEESSGRLRFGRPEKVVMCVLIIATVWFRTVGGGVGVMVVVEVVATRSWRSLGRWSSCARVTKNKSYIGLAPK
jgi:hypothetical protein